MTIGKTRLTVLGANLTKEPLRLIGHYNATVDNMRTTQITDLKLTEQEVQATNGQLTSSSLPCQQLTKCSKRVYLITEPPAITSLCSKLTLSFYLQEGLVSHSTNLVLFSRVKKTPSPEVRRSPLLQRTIKMLSSRRRAHSCSSVVETEKLPEVNGPFTLIIRKETSGGSLNLNLIKDN